MEVIKKVLENGLLSDVSFSVGEEEEIFMAHKCILVVRSSVFSAMFNGNFKESEEKTRIHLPDSTPSPFREFLEYLYLDKISLKDDNWAPILYLADKYDLIELKKMSEEFVLSKCSYVEACGFYSEARRHRVLSLVNYIKNRIVFYPNDSLHSDSFLKISSNDILSEILSDDELNCDEIEAFRAALRWASSQSPEGEESGPHYRNILGPALFALRFPNISAADFDEEVIPSGILLEREIVDIFLKRNNLKKDPIDFPSTARIRLCCRFDSYDVIVTSTKHHSIRFKVDKKIRIHGYFIYNLPDEGKVNGKMALKLDDGQKILEEKEVCIKYNHLLIYGIFNFPTPISIEPHTHYTASLQYDSLPQKVKSGVNGKERMTVDGVEWTFMSDPSSPETNVDGGILPTFAFSRSI